jgi:poly-gamma-glutamate synthesis protein (capsule biosynthesis protein)
VALATLLFGGDIMLNAVRPTPQVFSGIATRVSSVDLAFANLEVPLTKANTPTRAKTAEEIRRRDQFILRADPGHGAFLGKAGFDLLSLGNNHAMDYGAEGLREMRAVLLEAGIEATGAGDNAVDAQATAVKVLPDGTRVGLISAMAFVTAPALRKTSPATRSAAGVNVFSFGGVIGDVARAKLARLVTQAKESCDFLVVALHWGTERKTLPNPYQVELGRALVDAGADVVWGHHPHVLQGAELYRGKPILYSMGNLISPLGGETGLIEMSGLDKRARFAFFPAAIGRGRVTWMTGRRAEQARKRFRELCSLLVRRHPNPRSRALL